MAKWYGSIGFAQWTDDGNGVWKEHLIERKYCGDMLRSRARYAPSERSDDDITISNELSFLADRFAFENLGVIRYVVIHGTKWTVTDVELTSPRLKLTIGGMYDAIEN